ncbi:hypothetical protein [Duganella sp. LjRoot269]|uniref:hypothetical protein n=1 Tax=Duganella sp. LjRoot269 TaxID=3342305 RepID=UPI003ECF1C28
MGEAKGRRAALVAWEADLSDEEKTIVSVCKLIHARLNKDAGFVRACYFFAMLLRKHLKEQKGILVTPVVGWAGYKGNVFGHAWAEYQGKIIDLSLTQTTEPIIFPSGPLVILGQPFGHGVTYEYIRETSDDIAAVAGEFRVSFGERMRMTVASDDLIDEYFNDAPPEHRYAEILSKLN